ncbi:hypothetical protein P2G42_06955 [Klebsiella electrica]|uniref:hypothetical protein n=1 Tax=Klebsiella electrica TaxID=1259973 RepID=UPI0025523630|nr:hypothetical protein [Klebsiella electrica]WIO44361.1 hypothetical protein P2G42_06955 [Klebsiella electrica]
MAARAPNPGYLAALPCSPGQRSATGGYFRAPVGNHPDGGASALSGLPDRTTL